MIRKTQDTPIPTWEFVQTYDYLHPSDLKELVDFLQKDDLPQEMSLEMDGTVYWFENNIERGQFLLGFMAHWRLTQPSFPPFKVRVGVIRLL